MKDEILNTKDTKDTKEALRLRSARREEGGGRGKEELGE